MKYVSLVWSGIWRKRGRAILMLLQIVSVFVLFGLLQGVDSGIQAAIAKAHGDRLYVMSNVSLQDALPVGMLSRIRSVPGVKDVSRVANLVGTYQKPNQYVPVSGVDVDAYFKIYDELKCSSGAVKALEKLRTGAIVGGVLMRQYGWKVGEHIVLQGNLQKMNGSRGWGFDIVGVCENPEQPDNTQTIVAQYDYLNESRAVGRDRTNVFVAKIDSASQAGTISLALDNAFANSSNETHTRSEADMVQGQVQQIGNLGFILHGIIGAVFFAVLFSTGALMMQSLRERIPELAALKAIGFSSGRVVMLVIAESTLFCLCAAFIGLAIAAGLMPLADVQGISSVPGVVFALGAGCALVLALVAVGAPAWRAARLRVATALMDR